MTIYIVVFLISLFAARTKDSLDKSIGPFLILVLFIILACRAESVGIDTVNYYNNAFSSAYDGENHSFEILFVGFCDAVRELGLNTRWCIYFLSMITFVFLSAAAKRFHVSATKVCFFYILFNFYTFSFNIARQMAACSIVLYAYSYLVPYEKVITKKNENDILLTSQKDCYKIKDLLIYFFLVVLAMTIHTSAIIFLFVALLRHMNIETKNWTCIGLIIVFLTSFAVVQVLRELILSQAMGVLSAVMVYDSLGAGTEQSTLSVFGFIYRSIAYVFHGYVLYSMKEKLDKTTLKIFLSAVLLQILLSAFYGNIYRVGIYLTLIYVIVYAKYFQHCRGRKKIVFWMCTFYFGIEYYLSHVGNIFETVPYKFELFEIF